MPQVRAHTMWSLLGLLLLMAACGGEARQDAGGAAESELAAAAGSSAGDWYVEDYEVEIAQASSLVATERNRRTGERRTRSVDVDEVDVETSRFRSQEITVAPAGVRRVPSPFGSARDTGISFAAEVRGLSSGSGAYFGGADDHPRERASKFDRQWKSIMEGLEQDCLVAVDTVEFPENASGGTWKRAQAVPNAARLSIGEGDDLPLQAMEASVRIDGFRARVVLDLFFENDRDKQLAGDFQLRLPDGAVPFYLAFGETKLATPTFTGGLGATVEGIRRAVSESPMAPREARVVPREIAAHAFEETVREAVDPALLEWSGAGVFETRVFPLLPKRLHRIVVGYELELLPLGRDLLYRLRLPEGVPDLRVNLRLAGVEAQVAPAATMQEGVYQWRNPGAHAVIALLKNPGPVVLQGADPEVGNHFAVQLVADLPRAEAPPHERAVFLVDVSLSENPERFNLWLDLMEQILQRNRATLREFAVAFFNVETFRWSERIRANTAANVAELRQYAEGLALEGATDIGQALRVVDEIQGPYDLFLLSDGAVTWGDSDLSVLARAVGRGCPVFAYTSGLSGTDRRVLAYLSRHSGGALFSVDPASLAEAATAHRQRPWQLRGLSLAGCSDLMLRGDPQTIYPGQRLLLVGRGLPPTSATLDLVLARDGVSKTLRLPLGKRVASPLAVSTYGQVAVHRLEALGGLVPEAARAYAQHYRVVGRTCSLLMLDSDAGYERFGIRPADDTKVILADPASALARETWQRHADSLRSPKARFVRMLERIGKMHGVKVGSAAALATAIGQIPGAVFRIHPAPLQCKAHGWEAVGPMARKRLRDRDVTYAVVSEEAAARYERYGSADGLKALSSLLEHRPGDMALAREIGRTALGWKEPGQAYHVLRRVAERRPYQVPIYLALARCLASMGKTDLALLYFETALAAAPGTRRFGDFAFIAGHEYMRFLREIERGTRKTTMGTYARNRLKELGQVLRRSTADLVVVLSWNTDNTDVDLHVTDAAGEHCYYQHRVTRMGGRLSADVTTGQGPEMFVLENAEPGTYEIKIMNFASDVRRTSLRSRVDVTVYEDWGRANERRATHSLLVSEEVELLEVTTLTR